ncbi:MAG: hypothetical protein ACFE0Q_16530 [Anaerolineae bacterium]
MSEQEPFTAVIYFHGIGQQSRYQSLSQLLESFDDYAVVQDDEHLERFTVEIEDSRSHLTDQTVGYVTFRRDGKTYRFYEVYWAPLTAIGLSALSVLRWLFGHILTPIRIWRSTWNTRRRWRTSYLYSLWEKRYTESSNFTPFKQLITYYNQFCDDALRGSQQRGNFDDFMRYLRQNSDDSELYQLAQDWREHMRRIEFWNFFVLMTLTYVVLVVPILTLSRVLHLAFADLRLQDLLQNDLLALAFYGVLLLLLPVPIFFAKFLRDYVGDVQLWSTYEENDEKYDRRKAILQRGLEMTTHVLQHEGCERAIIVGHSLGTTIALDTLLAIGRHNRAVRASEPPDTRSSKVVTVAGGVAMLKAHDDDDLHPSNQRPDNPRLIRTDNIEYLVTFGSPIDKIHYLFESKRGDHRPYELIVDDLRGDISYPPFVHDNGIPNFRWLNFWSQEDYISGALFTASPREFKRRDQQVDNILIKSYEFPAPARAHNGYFRDDLLIGLLYRLIFLRENPHTSDHLRTILNTRAKSKSQRLRDSLLIGSWSLLFAIVFDILGWNLLQAVFSVIFFLTLSVVIVLAVYSLVRGANDPFKRWQD